MKPFLFLWFLTGLSFLWFEAQSQEVEHNFEMKPQKTNCDSIDINSLPQEDKITQIEVTKFRTNQNFQLNRINGFQAAWFYSCDNKTGFLIVKIDNEKRLYENVSVTTWNDFQSSGDFLGFINKQLDPE